MYIGKKASQTMTIALVVTKTDPGWNAPIAVFIGIKWEVLERRFPSDEYMIDEIEIESSLANWPKEDHDE